ncbi:MAG TPA: hypothetical protein VGG10_05280 [Rhizomicrobium sp.]|jgi:hypothetical protein
MTTTNWRSAVTGDFAKSGKWSDGRPGIKDDAVIAATGAAYTVKVISADAAHVLTLDSANAKLLEKGQGSLHVGTLNIERGTAVLTTANTIGKILMTHGSLDFSNSAALGNAAISIDTGGSKIPCILAATATAEIANDITMNQGTIAVDNGATLKLDGTLAFNTVFSQYISFGSASAKPDGSSVVDLDGTLGAMDAHTFITISGATLGSSIAQSSEFDTLISNAQQVNIEANSVLDLTHQDGITLQLATGQGQILNSGAHEALTLIGSSVGGIKGDFDVTLDGGGIGGTIALSTGDAIHVVNGGELTAHFEGNEPAIDLQDPSGSEGVLSFIGATFDGVGPTVDLGTGHDNIMMIDHNFIGTIINFGGHNGSTDFITFQGEAGKGVPSLQYQPNEAGTGGELIVQYGTELAVSFQ